MNRAEKKVLERIKPPEKLPDKVYETVDNVQNVIPNAKVMLGGSTAKGTYLKGDHDYDVFVRFNPENVEHSSISDILEESLQSVFDNVVRVHGSRDYFHVEIDEFFFEFIPVLHVKSSAEAENVTDMSPLHVEHVTAKIQENPDMADEVRLLKQFCKAQRIYGAESYIGGFSGYMVELLVIHYGTFQKTLDAVSGWEDRVVLDPEGHHKDAMKALNESKLQSPLVMVDPVQPERNASAALKKEAFDTFREVADEYLSVPEEKQDEFFVVKPLDIDSFKKLHSETDLFVVELDAQTGKPDVAGAKCYKAFQFMLRELQEHGFLVHASDWEYKDDRAVLLFAMDKKELDKEDIKKGPPLEMSEHVSSFKEEHSETFEKEGRIYAREKREFTKPDDLLKALCKDKYVLERVDGAVLK